MAQKLSAGIRHIAEWGPYQIEIDARAAFRGVVVAIVRASTAPYTCRAVTRLGDVDAALTCIAKWLEQHHCGAFVNGQRRSLVDFLVFVPAVSGAFLPTTRSPQLKEVVVGEEQPNCRTCSKLGECGDDLCANCWEVERRLVWYLESPKGRAFVVKSLQEAQSQ